MLLNQAEAQQALPDIVIGKPRAHSNAQAPLVMCQLTKSEQLQQITPQKKIQPITH